MMVSCTFKNIIPLLLIALLVTSCNSSESKSDREKNDEYYARFDQRKKQPKRHKPKPSQETNDNHDTTAVVAQVRQEQKSIKSAEQVQKEEPKKAASGRRELPEKSNISIAAQDYVGDSKSRSNTSTDEVVLENAIVETPAQYPGGEAALLMFIANNLVYPSIAQEQDIQGRVTLRFKVEKDGSIGEVRIVKGLSKECDTEAVKVVKKLRRFTPARQQGHPVAVRFTLPIRFQLS